VSESFDVVFYDGHCGLCHRAVKFTLAVDRGAVFRFAPLDSDAFRRTVDADTRAALPDSIVVRTADGRLLTRSDAILHILSRSAGPWRFLAPLGRAVPRFLRDPLYNAVARIRRRMFAPPPAACPMLPPELRSRFLT
jgi:predicted DCC family thiol-disulfide oxidoreductase YuxK